MEIKIGNYEVVRKLGSGAFGEVYLGKHVASQKDVAIKIESKETKFPQLFHEAKILKALKGSKGIPDVKHYTTIDDYYVMVFELLGPSLEELFKYCGRKFSMKTVCMIALQILERIETVHTNHLIHRDIKPENFLIGSSKPSIIYMIDFGLAKRFREPKTGMHIPWKEGKNLTGTARYASLNTHLGYEQSRRDDLEGLAYMLIYFCKGMLPWQGLPAKNKKDKYKRIKDKLLNYCRALKFEDKPCISDLRELFDSLMTEKEYANDNEFDWVIKRKLLQKEKLTNSRSARESKSKDAKQASRQKGTERTFSKPRK